MVIATPTKSKVKLATEQMANPSMKLPDTSLAAPTMIGEMNIPKAKAVPTPSFPRRRESIGLGQRRGEIGETDWF